MSFSRCCFVDRFGRNTETFHNFSIENCYSSRRQSSHRKFLLSRNSQFSYDEHVERSVECHCHFVADRNTASRQGEDNDVVPVCKLSEFRGKLTAGLNRFARFIDVSRAWSQQND